MQVRQMIAAVIDRKAAGEESPGFTGQDAG